MPQFPKFTINVDVPPRQPSKGSLPPGTQEPVTLQIQAMSGSFAWGSEPGTATLVYVGSAPALFGSAITFNLGINFFNGICKSCVQDQSTGGGNTYVLEFADAREFLKWDYVYCAFNKVDIRMVNGLRRKRYKHLLPGNYNGWFWTYTNAPLQGWQILTYIMQAKTVGTPWTWDLTDRGLFAGVLDGPVIDLDFSGGRRLDAALNELCAKAGGVVFSLIPTVDKSYQLVFSRKGYLGLVGLPDWILIDDAKDGAALADNPTNIRVLGDRNVYQVMSVPLVPDWAVAWNAFLVFEQFADSIYQLATDPATGIRFNATPSDPEQYVGRLLATAYANEITVRDYVALVNAADPDGIAGNVFNDTRKFNGRLRALMPAALYLQQLVFRAFKPNITSFVNRQGYSVPLDALNLADNLLCRVDHNAATGEMTYETDQPTDSNGYAIVKGYQIMPELLRMAKSEQWNVNFFSNANRSWGQQSFQIDDSGEGNRFLVFDEPLIISSDTVGQRLLEPVDAHLVFNAAAQLVVPDAQAALCFLAEPYSYWKGTYPNISRDSCENVPNLFGEYVVSREKYDEIRLASGQTADQAANDIANFLLLAQYWYYEGGRTHRWDGVTPLAAFGTQITSMVDRVSFRCSPAEGVNETVDLTSERRRDAFEPERDLERRTIQNSLFPGQMELRHKAELIRQSALSIRQLPKPVKDLFTKFISGGVADDGPVTVTYFKPGTGSQLPTGTLPAGSIVRRQPLTQSGGKNVNTIPDFAVVADEGGNDTRNIFMGVTPVHNVDATKPFTIQTGGTGLAQVQGPVAVNDPLGLSSDGANHLIKSGKPSVGTVLEAITDTSVKLVKVSLGASAPSGGGGINIRGEYDPDDVYNLLDLVVISMGINQGTYIDISGISLTGGSTPPYAGGGNWMQLPGGLLGEWF